MILLIARRELYAYLRSPLGYCIVAAVLCLHGLLFNVMWMDGEKLSYDVLEGFFYQSSGFVATVAVLLSMRLFAEERQTGTEVLLLKSPTPEREIVAGKFLGGFVFLCGYIALTSYMPLLVLVNGKVTLGRHESARAIPRPSTSPLPLAGEGAGVRVIIPSTVAPPAPRSPRATTRKSLRRNTRCSTLSRCRARTSGNANP